MAWMSQEELILLAQESPQPQMLEKSGRLVLELASHISNKQVEHVWTRIWSSSFHLWMTQSCQICPHQQNVLLSVTVCQGWKLSYQGPYLLTELCQILMSIHA